jgi:hypothetical protein
VHNYIVTDIILARLTMFCKLLFVALLSVGSVHAYGENSCRACNCQFNNVQVLTELIERIVNDTLLTGMREDIVNTLQNHFGTCSYSFVCVHYLLNKNCSLFSYLDTSEFDLHWRSRF